MARQPFNPNDPDGRPTPSPSLNNFQFTFSVSSSSSAKNSFIEPDPDAEETDSESLTESVQTFPEEFGRTYHAYKAGSYAFPNDQLEQDRLDLQNEAMVKLFGNKLFFAPLPRGNTNAQMRILDIATGMGDWAIKMGDAFPQSEIIATDLSPIQPRNVPPNVNFFVEDSSQPWYYTHRFDYIHTRTTAGCWSNFKTEIADQAFQYLHPGGYFESQEFDAIIDCDDETLDPAGDMAKWFNDLCTAADVLNRPVVLARNLRRAYQEAGFVDIQERIFKMPLNPWPKDERLKELGRMWERNFVTGLSGFSFTLFNRAFNMTPAEIELKLVDVRRDMTDTKIHAYLPIYVVTGRKPFEDETPMRRFTA